MKKRWYTGEQIAFVLRQAETGTPVATRPSVNPAALRSMTRIESFPRCHGPKFVSRTLDPWAYDHQVTMDFSRPGKPTDSAYSVSFNGQPREECLNVIWFLSLEDAQAMFEVWRRDYNESRPRTALGHVPPAEFADWDGLAPSKAGQGKHENSLLDWTRNRGTFNKSLGFRGMDHSDSVSLISTYRCRHQEPSLHELLPGMITYNLLVDRYRINSRIISNIFLIFELQSPSDHSASPSFRRSGTHLQQ